MITLDDRIEMADTSDGKTLDELFQALEPTPEGYRVEIVEGTIYMSPQRDVHWEIIRRIIRALEDAFGMDLRVFSDVRIDFPGEGNGFCPDIAKLRDGAKQDGDGHWRYEDVEFVAEVISRGTGQNDYGAKKTAYAVAEVPVYLIADPYQRKCHVYTKPADGEYLEEITVTFGGEIDLTKTALKLTLATGKFPHD
jgi:Uma2 family endonuclease